MMKDFEKVIVLLRDNTYTTLQEWQSDYGLEIGSSKIGKYFSFKEPIFASDLERYKKLIVCEPLMQVLDFFREVTGMPININSFNRDEKKQIELKEKGLKTALFSPHVQKMAADIDTLSNQDTLTKVQILKTVSKKLDIKIRIGFNQYMNEGQTFIHVDVCPEYYGNGKSRHKDAHPVQWENEITW